jgi:hypothetical protein
VSGRRTLRLAIVVATCAVSINSLTSASALSRAALPSARVHVGHGLSIAVPEGWQVSHRAFTACVDPIERFSLRSGDQVLMIQERLNPVPAELSRRPRHFEVQGTAGVIECCSIPGRKGWMIEFGDHGRAFYAYLYPGGAAPDALLQALDSFSARTSATPRLLPGESLR